MKWFSFYLSICLPLQTTRHNLQNVFLCGSFPCLVPQFFSLVWQHIISNFFIYKYQFKCMCFQIEATLSTLFLYGLEWKNNSLRYFFKHSKQWNCTAAAPITGLISSGNQLLLNAKREANWAQVLLPQIDWTAIADE